MVLFFYILAKSFFHKENDIELLVRCCRIKKESNAIFPCSLSGFRFSKLIEEQVLYSCITGSCSGKRYEGQALLCYFSVFILKDLSKIVNICSENLQTRGEVQCNINIYFS